MPLKMKSKKGKVNKPKSAKSESSLSVAPAAVSYKMVTKAPVMKRTKARSLVVSQRELIVGSVAGSTDFALQVDLSINPGLATSFPWLAPIASQWQQYRIKKLVFEWIPIAATNTAGDYLMAFEYNASEPVPSTEQELSAYEGAIMSSTWCASKLVLDLGASNSILRKTVRQVATAGDIKTFDIGRLIVATNNCPNTNNVGKLYADYDIEFFVPQVSVSSVSGYANQPNSTDSFGVAGTVSLASGVSTPIPWTALFTSLSPEGTGSGTVWTWPAGCYQFVVNVPVVYTGSTVAGNELSLEVLRNGYDLTPQKVLVTAYLSGNTVEESTMLSACFIVSLNGTDSLTFQIYCGTTTSSPAIQPYAATMLVALA